MKHSLDGARAGLFAGLVLSAWASSHASAHLGDAPSSTFFGVALGTLGALALAYALGLGAALDAWRAALLGGSPKEADPARASSLAAASLAALIVGVGTGGVHAAVTGSFARVTFQSLGLALTAAGLSLAAAVAWPALARLASLAPGLSLDDAMGGWRSDLATDDPDASLSSRLLAPALDLRAAASLLLAPALAGLVGAGVGVFHSSVASKADGVSAQATRLAAAAAILTFALAVAWPILRKLVTAILSPLPLARDDQARPRATLATLGLLGLGALGVLAAGYSYAARLEVFPAATMNMTVAAALLPPAFMAALSRVDVKNPLWRLGVPVAAASSIAFCAWGAWGWASQSADMRNAVTSHGALVSPIAKQLQRFADADADGYADAMGAFDCDDSDPTSFPGARDVPGDGIDQDCSGADSPPPPFTEHPAYKATYIAVAAGKKAALAKAQEIPDPPRNLVFVIVDTLRQDHLGYAGYPRPTSPNIDALAAESSIFTDAYATAPHTPRSIPCMFFSRYPSHMKWRGAQYNYPKVRPENLGWFEVLADKGWENYGMSSHFYFEPKRGMGQGFKAWDNEGAGTIAESNEDIAAPRIWAKTEPLIAELGQKHAAGGAAPFSLFVHFFEPHGRWIKHKEHDFGTADTVAGRHINKYDSEIAYVDTYIGKLVASLKAQGLYEDTVIVLTSDHGEAFKDHGLFFHGQNLYNEVIKVPLLVRVPGWKPRRIEGPVSLIDLAPTHLDLVGLTIPTDFEGQSLAPAMLGQEPVPDRPVFSELLPYTNWKEHHKAVIHGDLKYIHVLTAGTTQLYDLKADPKEQENLIRDPAYEEKADRMRATLDAWMGR
jgi:arylsulfatase A-like enzyme